MNKGGCAVGKKEGKGGCKLGKKKKLIVMTNKGGCAEGKKEGKGGCKVGKKKKIAVKPIAKKKAMVGKKKLVIVSNGPFARQKKLKDTKAKTEEVKKEIARQKKAKAEKKVAKSLAKVKKVELPELMAITGLGKSEANAKSPLELFGMLPKELGQMVLNPSQRGGGVKVGEIPISKRKFSDKELAAYAHKTYSRPNTYGYDFTKVRYGRIVLSLVGQAPSSKEFITKRLREHLKHRKSVSEPR